jgi:hypothetical protein
MTCSKKLVPFLICLSLLTAGCVRDVAKTLSEIIVVQQELTTKYGEQVNVSINTTNNSSSLIITFINSGMNLLGTEQRAHRALESAKIARAKYPTGKPLDQLLITFIKHTTKFVVFNYTETIDYYSFDANLAPTGSMAESGVDIPIPNVATRARYHQSAGQSDIEVTPLTLDGRPGEGLTMVPYFSVAGDANKEKAAPPGEVHLDFNSHYKVEKYQQDVVFRFIVDGKSVLQTTGRFTRWPQSGELTQFCYLTFPYAAFTRITRGESLTIRLGDNDFPLSDEQYQAIKLMTTYVK